MHTPQRTLLTLLVVLALAAGTLGPVAAPARAAGPAALAPNAAADGGPWASWFSEASARWASLRSLLAAAPAGGRGPSLSPREGVTADPNGKPGANEDGDGPVLRPQEGGTVDPNG